MTFALGISPILFNCALQGTLGARIGALPWTEHLTPVKNRVSGSEPGLSQAIIDHGRYVSDTHGGDKGCAGRVARF
jgi:hypothetical protein